MTERSPGHWRLRVNLGEDPATGRQRYATATVVGGKRAAQRRLAEMVTEADRASGSSISVGDLLQRWLEHLEALGRSPTTLREYRRLVERSVVPALGDVALDRLRPADLDRAYREWLASGLGAASVHRRHALLSAALHQAVRWGWLERSPAEAATPPVGRSPEITEPTLADLGRFLRCAEERDVDMAAVVLLALLLGARRGELCALRWPDVSWDPPEVRIARSVYHVPGGGWGEKDTKAHAGRWVSLDPLAAGALRARRARAEERAAVGKTALVADAFCFSPNLNGARPLPPDSVTHFVTRVCRRSGVDLHLHALRHWSLSQLIRGGADVRTVAARAGHRDPTMTLRVYSHALRRADQEGAVALGALLSRAVKNKEVT